RKNAAQAAARGRRTHLPRARVKTSISAFGAPPRPSAITPVAPMPALVPPPGMRAPPPAPVHNDSTGLRIGYRQYCRDGISCRGRQAENGERPSARHPLGFGLVCFTHFNLLETGEPGRNPPRFSSIAPKLVA